MKTNLIYTTESSSLRNWQYQVSPGKGGYTDEESVWKASQNLICSVPLGDCSICTLAVAWKFILWRGENKYPWTGDMDMDTLPETGGLNDCLLNDERRVLQHYSFYLVPRMLAAKPSPSHKGLEESFVKNLTSQEERPKGSVTSEIPPRSLCREVQKHEVHLYSKAFRQLLVPLSVWARQVICGSTDIRRKVSDADERDQTNGIGGRQPGINKHNARRDTHLPQKAISFFSDKRWFSVHETVALKETCDKRMFKYWYLC